MSPEESWKYLSPTKIVFGQNSFNRLKRYLLDLNIKQNILLVTGQNFIKKYGFLGQLRRMLYDKSIYHFDQVSPNPTQEDILKGIQFVGNTEIELVIALGGGSVLDAGKTLAILLKNPGSLDEYLKGERKITNRGIPVIAIPTTAGTASEVTSWATIWDMEQKRKYSLSHQWMFPEYAIVDPALTVPMPPSLTAMTGLDALTHAIESCWSISAQPISDVFALRAIRLVRNNIQKACDEPKNMIARTNMALASLFAGLAFNNTRTAACHSLSYPMTFHFDIPHGLAVSITLKEVIKYNHRIVPEKVEQIVEEFGESSVEGFIKAIGELMVSIGRPTKLRDLKLREEDLNVLIKDSINPERMKNNPANLTEVDIRTILKNVL